MSESSPKPPLPDWLGDIVKDRVKQSMEIYAQEMEKVFLYGSAEAAEYYEARRRIEDGGSDPQDVKRVLVGPDEGYTPIYVGPITYFGKNK